MIFDGPKAFPRSVVLWTKFRDHELRQMFSMLREREDVLQRELDRERDAVQPDRFFEVKTRLDEVQRLLIWMSHNVTGSRAERALRRRGFGSDREFLEEEKLNNTDPQDRIRRMLQRNWKG